MDCCVFMDNDAVYAVCTNNMHGVTHTMKIKINVSFNIYNLKNRFIMYLVSYMRRLLKKSQIYRI